MNHKFAVFYVSVISVALVGSLYANILNPCEHAVFTFPPEVQNVVNGTATMEIWWRWLPDTLEMVIKVNDDENNTYTNNTYFIDGVSIIFDSDNNGNITEGFGPEFEDFDDRGIFLLSQVYPWTNNTSFVVQHCWIDSKKHISAPLVWCPFIMATLDNTTTCTFKEGEGYTFNTSIPLKYINVKYPTPVIINYIDEDYRFLHTSAWVPEVDEAFLIAQLWM